MLGLGLVCSPAVSLILPISFGPYVARQTNERANEREPTTSWKKNYIVGQYGQREGGAESQQAAAAVTTTATTTTAAATINSVLCAAYARYDQCRAIQFSL